MFRRTLLGLALASVATVAFAAGAAQAAGFNASISEADKATVYTYTPQGAMVGTHLWVGPTGDHPEGAAGVFSSYSAWDGLPSIGGNDLAKYGWALKADVTAINGHVITYAGTFYLYAPGYGFDVDNGYLEKATFTNLTASYTSDWATAQVSGLLYAEAGARQPSYTTGGKTVTWPVPVDWASAGPALLEGTFVSAPVYNTSSVFPASLYGSQSGYLYGRIASIPEPMFFQMGSLLALGGLGLLKGRKR